MARAEEADAAVDAGGGRHRDMQARLDEGCVADVGVDRAGSVQSGGHLAVVLSASVDENARVVAFELDSPAGPRTNVYYVKCAFSLRIAKYAANTKCKRRVMFYESVKSVTSKNEK